ncbi:beta-ketoacyl-[acyl-carrier-protein] synthase family protein [bacterium]|nr:beta-ketoacyl-[acyl-carrier-protein] synthase family protein [bacterium]
MKPNQQVVITGIGTVNGLGINREQFWENVTAGKSGIDEITGFDSSAWRTHLGCEIREALPGGAFPDKVCQFAFIAAQEAITQAGRALPGGSTAVVLGTLQGGIQILKDTLLTQYERGEPFDIRPCYQAYQLSNLSRYIAKQFGFSGPVITPTIACAASGGAISRAFDLIRMGYVDAAITGGAETFSAFNFSGFNVMRSAAPTCCRPFSKDREGLVIGEGAGILVLESLTSVRKRGGRPLAVIGGTGLSADAFHITAPDPEGHGAVRAMHAALQDAGLEPGDIDYINAHGTGTPQNDKMETIAVKKVFGTQAAGIPISSIKAAVGHCMGAAGAIEAVASVLALQHQRIPPTINYIPGDPDCDLNYVPNEAMKVPLKHVLSNSFGFAGNDASLIFSAFSGDAV